MSYWRWKVSLPVPELAFYYLLLFLISISNKSGLWSSPVIINGLRNLSLSTYNCALLYTLRELAKFTSIESLSQMAVASPSNMTKSLLITTGKTLRSMFLFPQQQVFVCC